MKKNRHTILVVGVNSDIGVEIFRHFIKNSDNVVGKMHNNSFCYSLTKYASRLIPSIAKKWSVGGILTNVVRIGIGVTDTGKFFEMDRINTKVELTPVRLRLLVNLAEISKAICWLASKENTYIFGQIGR